jgi:DNA-binding CsgD family transcriptional regulator
MMVSFHQSSMDHEGNPAAIWTLHVVQSLGYGGFVLNSGRQLLAHNKAAKRYLGNGLVLNAGRVVATDPQSDERLQSLINTSLKSGEGPYGTAFIGLRRNLRLPLLVHVLRLAEGCGNVVSAVQLLLVTCDPERGRTPPHDMLIDVFGMTPAEARVAADIAAGQRLIEIAAKRRVKISTVQSHSKAVFGKTGTRGQAELAALLTRLSVLFPSCEDHGR